MVSPIDPSSIATHYYKLAHLSAIKYTIYTTTGSTTANPTNDQTLLELELSIRHDRPGILLTYYNKCLYRFQFVHIPDESLNITDDYPLLYEKYSNTVKVDVMANPPKPTTPANDPESSEESLYIPYISLTFLKAVKKLILFRLSLSSALQLFGNYAVVNESNGDNKDTYGKHIIHIDPLLLSNGDLMVCISQKNKLTLFDSNVLFRQSQNSSQLDILLKKTYVIYIVPSGIRCHLYYSDDPLQSFSSTPPKNGESIINLIKLSTGLDLQAQADESGKDILWVKLIPNLQHLNNQTSRISRFIHPVDNRKFILWPWSLCLIQFGYHEFNVEAEVSDTLMSASTSTEFPDPLHLLLDLMDFNITQLHINQMSPMHFNSNLSISTSSNIPGTHNPTNPFSVPSAGSNGITTADNNPGQHASSIGESHDIHGSDFENMNDGFLNNIQDKNPNNSSMGMTVSGDNEENNSGSEIDDLFGDDSEDEKDAENDNDQIEALKEEVDEKEGQIDNLEEAQIQNDELAGEVNGKQNEPDKPNDIKNLDPNGLGISLADKGPTELQSNSEDIEMTSTSPVALLNEPVKFLDTYIDIPKDQMTIAPLRNYLSKSKTPQSYSDPGAPPPIMPTPVFPASAVMGGAPTTNGIPSDNDDSQSRSIFLPLLFNPIIKSNIDTKYGKGGKFYVEKEPMVEERRRSLRATSVVGYESINTRKESEGAESLGNILHRYENYKSDDGEDMNEEESDEDEEQPREILDSNITSKRSPPLLLNVSSDPFMLRSSAHDNDHSSAALSGIPAPSVNNATLNSIGDFSSPMSGGQGIPQLLSGVPKLESPFGGFGMSNASVFSSRGNMVGSISPVEERSDVSDELSENEDMEIASISESMEPVPDSTVVKAPEPVHTPLVTTKSKSGSPPISESSNCSPLILRCINVSTIPNVFILNNIEVPAPAPSTNLSMYVDDIEENEWADDEETGDPLARRGMVVKVGHLNDILKWLTPSLIFDMGLNLIDRLLELKVPSSEMSVPKKYVVDGQQPDFERVFEANFPLAYRINLNEFINDMSPDEPSEYSSGNVQPTSSASANDIESQLSFLDDITNDEILNPRGQIRRLQSLDWDSIYCDVVKNKQNSEEYRTILFNASNKKPTQDDDFLFPLKQSKARVHKQTDTIVNLNSIGLNFWKYLRLSPPNGPKNFQMLLVSRELSNTHDIHQSTDCSNIYSKFMDSLVYNYRECNLGNISRINLTSDTRRDVDQFSNGMLLVGASSSSNFYSEANKRMSTLAEQIRMDLINKTNRFEFDRPLLVMFINYDDSVNSLLRIAKVCRNFQASLHRHQVPLVEVFSYVIPWSHIMKKVGTSRNSLRYLSNSKLCKISMNLYNQCPDLIPPTKKQLVKFKSIYTQLVKDPPSKSDFKFLNGREGASGMALSGKDYYTGTSYNSEIFLHMAYERSIDKNWFCAAWSDPLGLTAFTKTWFCSPAYVKSHGKDVHDIGTICDEIWEISIELFKKLNDDIIKGMSGFGGKKFLVLTRVNSIIPDDELVHWKRLSMKHKDVSLIVLSVNNSPKILFNHNDEDSSKDNFDEQQRQQLSGIQQNLTRTQQTMMELTKNGSNDFFKNFNQYSDGESATTSPNLAMATSPFNGTGISFHSPQQFTNAPGNFLSPQDMMTSSGGGASGTGHNSNDSSGNLYNRFIGRNDSIDNILYDSRDIIHAVLPKVPLPSFNSPTRLGMKMGYLLKEFKTPNGNKSYLVYEVNLLSCSNYWNLNSIMKVILRQYRNLITLNDVLGVRDVNTGTPQNASVDESLEYSISGLVPWHVAAVSKALDYLVHIDVKE